MANLIQKKIRVSFPNGETVLLHGGKIFGKAGVVSFLKDYKLFYQPRTYALDGFSDLEFALFLKENLEAKYEVLDDETHSQSD